MSSSSSSNHFIHDYGRYKRTRVSPQIAEVPSTLQSVRIMDQTPIIHSDNAVQQRAQVLKPTRKPGPLTELVSPPLTKEAKRSKRSKHSHKRRRRSMSSSSSSNHFIHDYGRYKRTRVSPQIAEVPSTLQSVRIMDQTPIIHSDNAVQQTKGSGSEANSETWSFDRAINEVFRLLPEKLCPKPTEENTPTRSLSGIEHLMENCASPLITLPQSKLVENTTKFIQSGIDSETLTKDWLCPHHLVSSLAPTKYYKSLNQYFPKENLPLLEPDASLLDISTRGRCSEPVKNLEHWEKRACKLVAINSHADLFSSAACLCLKQESMSVPALYRLLEAAAKSIRHSVAMSTILATELFQARHDAPIAPSKLLLDNSGYKLRNAPINAKSFFSNKIKEVVKSNYEAQQQRFLASSSTNANQQQKASYSATKAFKIPKLPNKQSRPKHSQMYRSKTQIQSSTSGTRKDFNKRSSNAKQFPSSKQASSSTKF